MAALDEMPITPRRPLEQPLAPWLRYDLDSDTLLIYFFGAPQPAVSYPVPDDQYIYLRLDIDTHHIIGVQIEGVFVGFLREHPEFIELARQAGAPEVELARIEAGLGVDSEAEHRRRALVRLMMADIESLASAES